MYSPEQLSNKLLRQWHDGDLRDKRLLQPDNWPLHVSIGKPSATDISRNLADVRRHVQQWRAISIGTVQWSAVRYRATGESVQVPRRWTLRNPGEWVAATHNKSVVHEFELLTDVLEQVPAEFHQTLVRQRHLYKNMAETEILQTCTLASALKPGIAEGAPLRSLSLTGIDSKFFERNRTFLTRLLDIRFAGVVSEMGLPAFLGAARDNDHWLLLADLDGTLLPFEQCRLRDSELQQSIPGAANYLIIENENCLHLLPPLPDTLAILGAGLNLAWLRSPALQDKNIAYWGDIDTWGLLMLGRARAMRPHLSALMMTEDIFDCYGSAAVIEDTPASSDLPENLTAQEQALYTRLLGVERGRLEQEFLPKSLVCERVCAWRDSL